MQKGFVSLLFILVISAIGISISTSLILLGINSTRTSLSQIQSAQARGLSNACMEEALQKLRESIYYSGNETLTLTTGNCQIQTITGTGNTNRTIVTTSTVGSSIRKVQTVVATINPAITISSWQEIP